MKKLIIRIGLGVIGLVLIVLLILYFRLNGIVKRTVEQQATNSLNLQTEVGGAQLSLFGGSLSLDEIQIASPQGFAAPFMLRLEEGDVKVKYGQLRQDPIRITSLVLDEPRLVIEQTNGKFNFSALTELSSRDTQDPMKLIIDDLQIKDATVVLRPGLPGLQNELKVPIPSLTLKNVGTGDGAENGAAARK